MTKIKFPPLRWKHCPACGEKHLSQFKHCDWCMAGISVRRMARGRFSRKDDLA